MKVLCPVVGLNCTSKEILPALSFEAIADVTGAVIAMGTDVLGN